MGETFLKINGYWIAYVQIANYCIAIGHGILYHHRLMGSPTAASQKICTSQIELNP